MIFSPVVIGSQPALIARVQSIDHVGVRPQDVVWGIGGISLLLNEQHSNNTSMRNRYLGLNGATAFYPRMRENLIPDLTGGRARTFVGFNPTNGMVVFGVMAPTIDGAGITNSGITYHDMYTSLRNIGCNRALNLDGGQSTKFRLGPLTVQVSSRDVICQLTAI